MSCRITSKHGCLSRCATFALLPVKKLSTHSTSSPSDSRRSQRCEPRKPAPPVTRTLFNGAFIATSLVGLPGTHERPGILPLPGNHGVSGEEKRLANWLVELMQSLELSDALFNRDRRV